MRDFKTLYNKNRSGNSNKEERQNAKRNSCDYMYRCGVSAVVCNIRGIYRKGFCNRKGNDEIYSCKICFFRIM